MTLDLNIFDPDDMIAQYSYAQEQFNTAVRKAKQELRAKVRQKINRELSNEGLIGSSYAGNIIYAYTDTGLTIQFPDYWMYIEFGTGLVGSENPHPDQSFQGVFQGHNVGKYSSDPSKFGPVGYFPYPTKDGGWKITAGQKAHPIVYKTWIYAEARVQKIYEKHLREAGF